MPNENEIQVTTSKFFSLNVQDFLRGLIVAVITAVLTVVYETVNEGTLTFDWKKIGITAILAASGYLLKNLFQPAQTVVKFKPPVEDKTTVTVTPPPDANKN